MAQWKLHREFIWSKIYIIYKLLWIPYIFSFDVNSQMLPLWSNWKLLKHAYGLFHQIHIFLNLKNNLTEEKRKGKTWSWNTFLKCYASQMSQTLRYISAPLRCLPNEHRNNVMPAVYHHWNNEFYSIQIPRSKYALTI